MTDYIAEKRFIIQVLSDYLNNSKTAFVPDLNWKYIISIVKQQELTGIFYHQLKPYENDFDVDCKNCLEKEYAFAIFNYQKRLSIMNKVGQAFLSNHIPFILIKGMALANLYSVPCLRTMGDVDVLIHSEDKEKADRLMKEIGFHVIDYCGGEWVYDFNGIMFELHHTLMTNGIGKVEKHNAFLSKCWEYSILNADSVSYCWNWNYHFVYLLFHIRRHLYNNGVGLRQFMDLTIVMKKCELDWQWIEEELKELGLLEMAFKCLKLCEDWFGVACPLLISNDIEKYADFLSDVQDEIFKNGVYGFCNIANEDGYHIMRMNRDGRQAKDKIKMSLHILFPSYSVLCKNKYYSYIIGKPWLTPIVWIIRPFRSIIRGHSKFVFLSIVKPFSISKRKVEKRKAWLKKWGL